MKKDWQQANPRDQIVTVINAARWHVENIQAGLYNAEILPEKCARLDELFDQVIELAGMVSGKWPIGFPQEQAPRFAAQRSDAAGHPDGHGAQSLWEQRYGRGSQYRQEIDGLESGHVTGQETSEELITSEDEPDIHADIRAEFEFHVTDEDGLWGGVKMTADTEKEAREKITRHLLSEEVDPRGSLKSPFELELVSKTPVEDKNEESKSG